MNQKGAAVLNRPNTASLADKRMRSNVKKQDAPTHDGLNLLIKIDVTSQEAKFYCQAEEHAGNHQQRHVRFLANAACRLHLETAFFDPKIIELSQGVATDVEIQNGAVGSATYFVSISEATTTGPTAMVPLLLVIGDPKIVVP